MTDHWHTVGMVVLIALCALLINVLAVRGEELHDHSLMGEVGKFYSEWKLPNGGKPRVSSCCNFKDCHETQVRLDRGKWSYLSVETGNWTPLPDSIIEHNQPDPEISPNSKPHVCEPHGRPVCAVIPGGQI